MLWWSDYRPWRATAGIGDLSEEPHQHRVNSRWPGCQARIRQATASACSSFFAGPATRTMALAWHPWAVIRVISFVVIGVVLSAPLLSRLATFRVDCTASRSLLLGAGAGLIVDIVLKALLAPTWQRLLLSAAGW